MYNAFVFSCCIFLLLVWIFFLFYELLLRWTHLSWRQAIPKRHYESRGQSQSPLVMKPRYIGNFNQNIFIASLHYLNYWCQFALTILWLIYIVLVLHVPNSQLSTYQIMNQCSEKQGLIFLTNYRLRHLLLDAVMLTLLGIVAPI